MSFADQMRKKTEKKLARLDKECIQKSFKEVKLLIKNRATSGYNYLNYWINPDEWDNQRFTQESVDALIALLREKLEVKAEQKDVSLFTQYKIHIEW